MYLFGKPLTDNKIKPGVQYSLLKPGQKIAFHPISWVFFFVQLFIKKGNVYAYLIVKNSLGVQIHIQLLLLLLLSRFSRVRL